MTEQYQQLIHVMSLLGQITIIAFVIERVFDYMYDYHFIRRFLKDKKGVKAIAPLAICFWVCIWHELDILAVLFNSAPHFVGITLTSLFMAGGSGAAMTLLTHVFGISQAARREHKKLLETDKEIKALQALSSYSSLSKDLRRAGKYSQRTLRFGDEGVEVIKLQKALRRLGYLDAPSAPNEFDRSTEEAIKSYQRRMGLKDDGIFGAVTRARLQSKRCGVSDSSHAMSGLSAQEICKWPNTNLNVYIHNAAYGMDEARCRVLIKEALTSWENISNIKFLEVGSSSEAHINIQWAFPHQEETIEDDTVYAFGFFPCGPRAGNIILDNLETWLDDHYDSGSDGYFVKLTVQHELGHALGLGHSDAPEDIMYYAPHQLGVREFSAKDITSIRNLYA